MSVTFRAEKCDGEVFRRVAGSPEINLSNANASAVLDVLGFSLEPKFYGSASAEELRAGAGRFFAALDQGRGAEFEGGPLDSGTRAALEAFGPGATVLMMSIGVSGIRERVDRILALAEFAEARGAEVGWG